MGDMVMTVRDRQNVSTGTLGDDRGILQRRLDFTPAASERAHSLRHRESKAERVLARLKEGPATSLNLLAVGGLRYGARIHELREAGNRIDREDFSHAGQEWSVYTLKKA